MEENRNFTIELVEDGDVRLFNCSFADCLDEKKLTCSAVISEEDWKANAEAAKDEGWRVTHIDGDECYTCEDCGMPIAYNEECGRDEEGIVTCIPCLSKMVVDCEEAESGKTTMAECLKCDNLHDCWRD
jgi:hypothetical protein